MVLFEWSKSENLTMHLKSITVAAVLLGLFSSAAMAGKRYAVVVGVRSYRPGQPLPELPYTENDASKLAETLKAGGYDVTLMTQTSGRVPGHGVMTPLSDYIRDQIDAVLDNPFLKDDDVVIVALAGHGVQYEIDEAGRKTPQFFFCPADADIRKLRTANEITERNRLINLSELYGGLKACKAGGKLLLVDACRNDPTKPGITRSLASNTLPPLPPPPGGTAAFFSCSANQKAFEDADLEHGVFFHHVIQALQGDADSSTAKRPADGQITLAELSQHVSVSTYDFVRNKFGGAKQAPELRGEFRLTVPLIELQATRSAKIEMAKKTVPTLADRMAKIKALGGLKEVQITNSVGMRMRRIPAGEFLMGSPEGEKGRSDDEGPQHRVHITHPFFMGETEVTQAQWFAVMRTKPWSGKKAPGGKKNVEEGSAYPATYLSWDEATEFCTTLSEKEGRTYRLPTEAEWEYACRAGANTPYGFGSSADLLAGYAWFAETTWKVSADENHLHEVAKKKPNAFELFDMHGNVGELCADWYDADAYKQRSSLSSVTKDPMVKSGPGSRVERGGIWGGYAFLGRSASRGYTAPSVRDAQRGFRVVAPCLNNTP